MFCFLSPHHGTGPAPSENISVYVGMVASATVRMGSTGGPTTSYDNGGGKSSHIAAMVLHVRQGNPEVASAGMGTAQNDADVLPGVTAAANESAPRHAAMPPNDNNKSGRRPYLSVATRAMTPPRRLGIPTNPVSNAGFVRPASLSTVEA